MLALPHVFPVAQFSLDPCLLMNGNEEFRIFADLRQPLSNVSWRALLEGSNCRFLHRDTIEHVRRTIERLAEAIRTVTAGTTANYLVSNALIVTGLGRLKVRSEQNPLSYASVFPGMQRSYLVEHFHGGHALAI